MKKDAHPDYHFIEVTLTTGESLKLDQHMEKKVIKLTSILTPLLIQPEGGKQKLLDTGGRVSKFKKKYEGLGF